VLLRPGVARAGADAAPEVVERERERARALALAPARQQPPLGALRGRAVVAHAPVARVAAELARRRPAGPRPGARKHPPAMVDVAALVEVARGVARADGPQQRWSAAPGARRAARAALSRVDDEVARPVAELRRRAADRASE
jgi:hypothetical protein